MTFYKVECRGGEIYILKIEGLPLVLIVTETGINKKILKIKG